MICLNPTARITISEIMSHPWMSDFNSSFTYNLTHVVSINEQIAQKVEGFGYSRQYLTNSLRMHDKNYCTTTYYLLLNNL
jgi:hypothetical protein